MSNITQPKRLPKTLKEKRWAKRFVETNNATQAAMEVYECKDRRSAAVIGYENLRKLNFEDILEAAGLDDISIVKPIAEGLTANRTISATVIIKSNDPKVRTKQATARDVDFLDVPDHPTRLRASQMALELKDKFPSKKMEVGVGGQELIEGWKKDLKIGQEDLDKLPPEEGENAESVRSVPVVDKKDVPKGALPVPKQDSPKDS